MALDTSFDGLAGLDGTITNVTILDKDSNPNRVIDDEFPFVVKVDWTVSPPATARLLDGKWQINLYAESLGPGPELKIGSGTLTANGSTTYTLSITVPPPYGGLASDETPPPDSGVYQLTVVLTYLTVTGRKTEMAGFAEGPTFMLREP